MASPSRPTAVLLGVQLPNVSDEEYASSLAELERLGRTLGVDVVARITQRRAKLDRDSVVGKGKLAELVAITAGVEAKAEGEGAGNGEAEAERESEADAEPEQTEASASDVARPRIVLVDRDISPSQANRLERACQAEVLDRTAVILAIFQRHARSREARLQVEIARLRYWAPRVRESSKGRDRQGGGIGGRGAGESQLELDRRKLRDRIAELRAELEEIERRAGVRRHRRSEQSTVALVGYTNAGKSSLMRALTGSQVEVADKLFATLDTTVRALQPETTPRILVSDTVGFIRKLPHDLVASFRSTLDEARDADLLLQLADASDPGMPAQLVVTLEVLSEIGAADRPRLLVLNKIDRIDEARREALRAAHPDALLISTRSAEDVTRLREWICSFFERGMVEAELRVPYSQQRIVAEIHSSCRVLSESHDEHGTLLRLLAAPEVVARLRASVA